MRYALILAAVLLAGCGPRPWTQHEAHGMLKVTGAACMSGHNIDSFWVTDIRIGRQRPDGSCWIDDLEPAPEPTTSRCEAMRDWVASTTDDYDSDWRERIREEARKRCRFQWITG